MDRLTLWLHLTEAENHVAEREPHLAKQEAVIAELDRDGHDTTDAKSILETLRQTRALHIQGRDRVLKELAE